MRGHYKTVGKLYLEDGIGQSLNHRAFTLDNIILRQSNHLILSSVNRRPP